MALFAKSDDEHSPAPKALKPPLMPPIEEWTEYDQPRDYIRIVCISDTHVKHLGIAAIPFGDVLIHAGDFSSTGKLSELEDFRAFMDSLPHKHKIVIAGNHDLSLHTDYYEKFGAKRFHIMLSRKKDFSAFEYSMQCRAVMTASSPPGSSNYIFLEDSSCNIPLQTATDEASKLGDDSSSGSSGGIQVYGSPWQPEFFNWAYNLPKGPLLKEKWDMIPNDTDILITHGPPLNILDTTSTFVHAGCDELLDAVNNRIRPRLHVFGHIHESYGAYFNGTTLFINASTCQWNYRPLNPPVVVHLPIDSAQPAAVVQPTELMQNNQKNHSRCDCS